MAVLERLGTSGSVLVQSGGEDQECGRSLVSPRRPRRRLIVPLFDVVADGGAPVHLEVLRADPGHLEGVTDGVAAELETPRITRLVRRTVVHHDGVALADRQICVARQRCNGEEVRVDSLHGGLLQLEHNNHPIKRNLLVIIHAPSVGNYDRDGHYLIAGLFSGAETPDGSRIIISNVGVVATEIVRSSTFSFLPV
jgi:hypothetical protein